MKKVVLNSPILDLDGNVVSSPTSRVAVDGSGKVIADATGQPVRETKPILFGKVCLDALVRIATKTDEEATAKFALASTLNDNLKAEEGTSIQLSDSDYEFIAGVMSRQPLIVKARFLEMVAENNA